MSVLVEILPLAGVALGAGLREVSTGLSCRRAVTKEAKVSARLFADDLLLEVSALQTAVATGRWLPIAMLDDKFDGWREHRATLAASVSREEWRLLRITDRRLRAVHGAVPDNPIDPLDEYSREMLWKAAASTVDCQTVLEDLAGRGVFSRDRLRPSKLAISEHLATDPGVFSEALRCNASPPDPEDGKDSPGAAPRGSSAAHAFHCSR